MTTRSPGLNVPDAFGDVEGLPEGVGVPGSARARSGVRGVDAHAKGLFAAEDDVDCGVNAHEVRAPPGVSASLHANIAKRAGSRDVVQDTTMWT
jgi:hypothetical protein